MDVLGPIPAQADSLTVLGCRTLVVAGPVTGAAECGGLGSEDTEDDTVDEEISIDPPSTHGNRDGGSVAVPSGASPAVCRFASPRLVFQRGRQPPVHRPQATSARPRTLCEFLEAAKSRSDALLQTPAVRRRLMELNFQPRRSSRIAGQPGGLNAEMK